MPMLYTMQEAKEQQQCIRRMVDGLMSATTSDALNGVLFLRRELVLEMSAMSKKST